MTSTPAPQNPTDKWANPVPPAVRRAAEAAEAAYKQPDPEPPVEGQPPEEGHQPNEGQPPAQQPLPEGQPPAAPPAPPEDRDWARDYGALEGRLRTEQRTNRQLSGRLEALEAQLQDLVTRQPAAPPAAPPEPQRFVSDEERNEFGEDMLNVVGKRAREEITPELALLREQLDTLKQNNERILADRQQDRATRFYQDLDSGLEGWREINTSDEFKDWLQEVDPYARKQRGVLLREAYTGLDAAGVLNFFKGYQREAAATTDPQTRGAPPAPSGKVPLKQFAAPGRARPTAAAAPEGKPTYTRAEIQQFYIDVRKGAWKGREADRAVLEADIIAAGHEGRVV